MQYQGSLEDRYAIYLSCADDGDGNDVTTSENPEDHAPLKTFDEWCGI